MADGGKLIIKIAGDNSEFTKTTKKLGDIGKKALKGIAVGAAAVTTAVAGIGKSAISAFAEYEQLVGGVETLFKDSADKVVKNAKRAFETAGLSANDYMNTVTSFSASLLQSVGGDTAKACDMADLAITDMSDNANKMGSSMESIQNAYQGFAKQNYTMLDNLKLGYGGTKEEMARLISDASKLDKSIKANDMSFGNIVKSIHAVQTQMGITGTTAKEASTTIQGSIGMLKASWTNLLTGLTDPKQNLSKLMKDVEKSFKTVLSNITPRIKALLPSIIKLLTDFIPEINKIILDIVPEILPGVSKGMIRIINTIIEAIPKMLPQLIQCGFDIISGIFTGMSRVSPLLTGLVTAFGTLVVAQKAATVAQAALNLAMGKNPVGLVIAGVAALAGGIAFLVSSMNSETEAERAYRIAVEEQTEAIRDNLNAIEERNAEIKKNAQNELNEIAYVEELTKQLSYLVDENGKVTDGYEERASFILRELNSALGTEYEMVDGIITKYGELKTSIYDVIEAKKLEIVANEANQIYEENFKNKRQLEDDWAKAMANYAPIKDEINSLTGLISGFKNELKELEKQKLTDPDNLANINDKIKIINDDIKVYENSVKNLKNENEELAETYELAEQALISCNNNLIDFEELQVKIAKTDSISEQTRLYQQFNHTVGNADEANRRFLEGTEEYTAQMGVSLQIALKNFSAAFDAFRTNCNETSDRALREAAETLLAEMKTYRSAGGDFENEMVYGFNAQAEVVKFDLSPLFKEIDNSAVAFGNKGGWLGDTFLNGITKKISSSNLEAYLNNIIGAIPNGSGGVVKKDNKDNTVASNGAGTKPTQTYTGGTSSSAPKISAKKKNEFIEKALEEYVSLYEQAQEAVSDINDDMLSSEKEYLTEKARIEKERAISEYKSRLENADTAEKLEEIKQDMLLNMEKEKQDKYLDNLKDTADKEKELRKEQQKQLEAERKEAKKNLEEYQEEIAKTKEKILSDFEALAKKHFKDIEEVAKLQENMRQKLSSYGSLFTTEEKDGKKTVKLGDLKQQKIDIGDYANNVAYLKSLGNVPPELLKEISNMSVEEGLAFTNALISSDKGDFNLFMADYAEKQRESKRLSMLLFKEEADDVKEVLKDIFDTTAEDFFEIGEDDAQSFGQGFMSKLNEVFRGVQAKISSSVSGLYYKTGSNSIQTNYSDNSNIYITTQGKTEHEELEALNNFKKLQKHTDRWEVNGITFKKVGT